MSTYFLYGLFKPLAVVGTYKLIGGTSYAPRYLFIAFLTVSDLKSDEPPIAETRFANPSMLLLFPNSSIISWYTSDVSRAIPPSIDKKIFGKLLSFSPIISISFSVQNVFPDALGPKPIIKRFSLVVSFVDIVILFSSSSHIPVIVSRAVGLKSIISLLDGSTLTILLDNKRSI